MYQIIFASKFLNNLKRLPPQVQTKFDQVIETLEHDPSPGNKHSIKLDNYHLWRIPVTRKYRLFYQYENNWIKLIQISTRNEGTYKGYRLDQLEEERICAEIPPWFIDDIPETQEYQPQGIAEEELGRYGIDEIYWSRLIELNLTQDDEELLKYLEENVTSPDQQNKILDCCVKKPLEQIEHLPGVIVPGRDSKEVIQEACAGKEFFNLILYLSEEQEKILEHPFDRPILVRGGAGTGKTVLAVHKTAQLAKKYHEEQGRNKILFTTYTPSLVNYVKDLLVELLGTEKLEDYGVDVDSVDNLAQKYYQSQAENKPKIIINREKSLLFLEHVWNSVNINRNLKNRILEKGGTEFILDEFIYYIEARTITEESQYQNLRRQPLTREISREIWKIYQKWTELIEYSGYITVEKIRSLAREIVSQKQYEPYKALIIDEAQDLSPSALNFLARLVSNRNNVFLTADINQSLYQRSYVWSHIESSFDFGLERIILKQSFRNTRRISIGCDNILPEENYIVRSQVEGENPKVILTDSLQTQTDKMKLIFAESQNKLKLPLGSIVVLTPNSHYSEIIAEQLTYNDCKAKYIKPENINMKNNFIQVLDLTDVKGLEFAVVVIVGLNQGLFPSEIDNQEVEKQQQRLFYVGCSRAIYSLSVFGSRSNPSMFLNLLKPKTYSWQVEEV